MSKVTPVILAGGSGTRLWPVSRKSYPKQFSKLIGDESLFQVAAKRVEGAQFAAPMVITNSDFRFIVTEQLGEVGIDPGAVFLEPTGRNTAPAILAIALHALAQDPEAVLLVMPSDHLLPDVDHFANAIDAGLDAVVSGQMVTFGVQPDRPETGYGYLELGVSETKGAQPLVSFIEKPDLAKAEALLKAGNYLWNAGIFLFAAKDIVAGFHAYADDLVAPVQEALDQGKPDLGFYRLDPEAWERARDISIDYAVMEKATNLSVVPFTGKWTDLGDWAAIWRESMSDDQGVVLSDGATAIDCKDSLLRSESENQRIVGIGLENIVAVAMPDAVIVCDKSRTQDVGQAVKVLRAQGVAQGSAFPKDHRPWGWFESLVVGGRFQVKRILVHPGASLSLQSHMHRSEHWIVVEGTAKVTVDDKVQLLSENESVYIPLGAKHRMENPGKVPMVLIEVQTGAYVGEDDIVRYEDMYARD